MTSTCTNEFVQVLFLAVPWICGASVIPVFRRPRLSLAEPAPMYYYANINGSPGNYVFGYDIFDPATGNKQFRNEERYPNGTVAGSYGYIDPFGKPRQYRYIADVRGYRVTSGSSKFNPGRNPGSNLPRQDPIIVSTEPSVTWTRSWSKRKPVDLYKL